MRNHRRPKALHEQVLLFIQPVESQSQLELCMLGTPRGHPCARAPHVQGLMAQFWAHAHCQHSKTLLLCLLLQHTQQCLIRGARIWSMAQRVRMAVESTQRLLSMPAVSRRRPQAVRPDRQCSVNVCVALRMRRQPQFRCCRAQAEHRQISGRGAHAEDARGRSANCPCAQNAHCLAAQLKADQARQRVVARPHADVRHVQIPASAPAARISCLLTWPCCSDR